MIEELLPSEVASVVAFGDDPSAYLLPEESAQLGWAVENRVREFATARMCARRALERLGVPPTAIMRGPHREPIWPSGIVGSITHCSGYRAAAVAAKSRVLTVGIDAEIHQELPTGVLAEVTSASERCRLAEHPGGIHWDRLLFSAKESVYKAWFPVTGVWLDFEDVEVSFMPRKGAFCARLLVSPSVLVAGGLLGFTGRFMVRDGLVLTAIAELQ